MICEEVRGIHQEGVQQEPEHVKAHRSKKEKQEMSLLKWFVTEGNERADELAKDGAMLNGGEMAQMEASTAQQKGRKFMRHCSPQVAFIVWWRSGTIVKNLSQHRKRSGYVWTKVEGTVRR